MASNSIKENKPDLDLDEIEKMLFKLVEHHINVVKDVDLEVTSDALHEIFNSVFIKTKSILRISTGVAQIKGLFLIDRAEVEQAMKMDKDGVDNYLPPTW